MTQPQPNRIIHVPRRFAQDEWGGTESVVLNLCRHQLQAGWQPEIHTSRALCNRSRETWKSIPIRRYRYSYPFLGLKPPDQLALDKKGGNLLSLDLFWNLLQLQGVRVFHAHVIKRMGGAVMTAARLRKKPFLVTLHGNVFDVPEAEVRSITAAQQGHLEWGKPFGILLRSRAVLHEADAVLCVGYSEYEKARQALDPKRVHFLPNGVNPEHFQSPDREPFRARLNLPENAFLFGCISRIDPQKNQLGLVQAFARVAPELPHAYLILSGPVTSHAYLEQVQQVIKDSGAAQRILLEPPVEPESSDHAALFAALDCFVLASRHEPFGIVAIEAWASGKPVIAAKVGGLANLVAHEKNGLLCPPGDEAALAGALKRLVTDPSACRAFAEAGRKMVLDKYTWKKVTEKLENLYQQLEGEHPA